MNLSKVEEYFDHNKHTARIHIIGCGSVGSTVAENLVRNGLRNFTLWDFDLVEAHNLANQMFRLADVKRLKTEALLGILEEINPEVKETVVLKSEGWTGQQLSGFVFLCVDNIELRREIVEKHMDNPNIKAMFDFRTRLEDAQHYAADWKDRKMKEALLNSMQFSHEEAAEETPVSACGVTQGVCPTVRIICARGVANFMNFWNGKGIKKMVLDDAFNMMCDAF